MGTTNEGTKRNYSVALLFMHRNAEGMKQYLIHESWYAKSEDEALGLAVRQSFKELGEGVQLVMQNVYNTNPAIGMWVPSDQAKD